MEYKYGLKDVATIILFDLKTGEVVSVHGFEAEVQKRATELISLRDKAKQKRIRKKINEKIENLVDR